MFPPICAKEASVIHQGGLKVGHKGWGIREESEGGYRVFRGRGSYLQSQVGWFSAGEGGWTRSSSEDVMNLHVYLILRPVKDFSCPSDFMGMFLKKRWGHVLTQKITSCFFFFHFDASRQPEISFLIFLMLCEKACFNNELKLQKHKALYCNYSKYS